MKGFYEFVDESSFSLDTADLFFYVLVTMHRNKFLYNKTNRRTNFPNLFLTRNSIHVSGSSSAHHQEFSTVHWALVYVT